MNKQWSIWQLIDSAFPSGGFVHSGGLESAAQHRIVRDASSLMDFARAAVTQTQRGVLTFTATAWDDVTALPRIDGDCDLFLNNAVANRASRTQGRALLATSKRVFEGLEINLEASSPGHLAPVFGAVCRKLDVDQAETLNLLLFMTARGCFSSAVRLGIVGPIEAQELQRKLSDEIQSVQPGGTAVQTSPLLDLVGGTQDRLYSRLFQS